MESSRLSRIDLNLWSGLAAMPNRIDALGAKLLLPDLSDRVFAAVDGQGRRHILIRLDAEDNAIRDVQSRGLSVDTIELTSDDGSQRYADIVCFDASGHEMFDLVATEIVQRLQTESVLATDCVHRIISKWRRFWNSIHGQFMSRAEAAGLFAELWCLRYWLLPHLQADIAINAWRGPFGARHDFEFACHSIEVKATLNRGSLVHRINGLDQMVPPASGSLYFLSMGLAEEVNGSDSLPGIVDSILQFLATQDSLQAIVAGRLMQIGYRESDRMEYLKTKYRVTHQSMYEVVEGFPKIVPGDFQNPLPSGVVRIEYDIALDGFGNLTIATEPGEKLIRYIANEAEVRPS